MTEKLQADVAIVGGGIVGASAALYLRRMGLRVVLLERDLCGSRSSGVNFGGVRRQGRALSLLPLAQRSHLLWGELRETIGSDGEYLRSGHLKIARSPADMASLEAYRERTRDFDLGLRLLDRHAVRERCPWLGDAAVGGSLCPEDGHANPRLVSPAIARAAQAAGAVVRERTEVLEASHDGGGFVLRATAGPGPGAAGDLELRAGHLLNCAGAWSGRLAAQFGEPVPLTGEHPAMFVTEPLPLFMNLSLGVEGGGIYARQALRGNCVIGGGRGFAIDAQRARNSQMALTTAMRQAVQLLPALRHAHVIRSWSGTEGYLPDHLPVVGASGTTPGLLHGFGFNGEGFQSGLGVGAVLADLVRDGRTGTPIAPLSITRFRASPTEPAAAVPQPGDIVHP
jgi:sarcosine oxidase subunit beta